MNSPASSSDRWRPKLGTAMLVRVLAFAVPVVAGYFAGGAMAALIDSPSNAIGVLGWWGAVIATAGVAAHVTERLTRKLIPLAALLRLTLAFPDKAPSRFRVALQAGNITQLKARYEEAEATGHKDVAAAAALILALSAALTKHDRRTRGHSERTRAFTDLLAEELGIGSDDRDKLRWAALLHDIGKLEVPREILSKTGQLDDTEFEIIKRHPIDGMRLIAPITDWLGPWAQTIEHHHERWDGTGYPGGLQSEAISLGARVVAVADAYDVMISGRSYQAKMSHARARTEVAQHAGTQFDPRVARALMSLSLGRLRWSTGPLAALADLPFLRPLQALGRDIVTVATAGALTISAATGVVPWPGAVYPIARISDTIGASATNPGGFDAGPPTGGDNTVTTLLSNPTTTMTLATTTTRPTTTTFATTTTLATTSTLPTTTTPTTTTLAGSSTVVAGNDQATAKPSDKINLAVLSNDTGPYDPGSLTIVDPPAVGSAQVTGGGKIRFDAPSNFTGLVTFTYQICSPAGACDTATVSVTVS